MNITQLLPAKIRPWSKAFVAFLGAVVSFLVFQYGDASWLAAVVQIATVLGVYSARNIA